MPNWIATNLYIRGSKDNLQKVMDNLLVTDEWRKQVEERNAKVSPKMVVNGKAVGTQMAKSFKISCDKERFPNGTLDFNRIIPTPLNVFQGSVGTKEEKRYGNMNCWYDWNIQNWGCKWNASECSMEILDDNTLYLCMWTPWSFPEPLMNKFCKLCAEYECTIDGEFAEEDFGGVMGTFQTDEDDSERSLQILWDSENKELYEDVWGEGSLDPIDDEDE